MCSYIFTFAAASVPPLVLALPMLRLLVYTPFSLDIDHSIEYDSI